MTAPDGRSPYCYAAGCEDGADHLRGCPDGTDQPASWRLVAWRDGVRIAGGPIDYPEIGPALGFGRALTKGGGFGWAVRIHAVDAAGESEDLVWFLCTHGEMRLGKFASALVASGADGLWHMLCCREALVTA